MAKAITYNNAGVVEAIKRNSGSTKFYPASYQGIIEAIEDWGDGGDSSGGGGTTVLPPGSSLPDTDNTAGDLVVVPNGDGDYFMYVFANGSWERLHITTEEVETAGSAPFALVTDDGVTVKNQKEINAYLDERITALSEKGYDDTGIKAELAQEVTDRTEGDQALQDQIDALEGYDDAGIKGELAQEVTDRTEGDQALQDQIDALEAYDDSAITGRVDNLEAAVEDLPTWIAEKAPEDKEDGDLWFDSGETGQLYVRYRGEWVVACPPVTDDELAGTVNEVEAIAQTALNKTNILEWSLHQQGELVKWDQERQDGMLLTLEEEIEQLKPSLERGVWNYNGEDSFTAAGNFILIQEFLEEEAQEQMCNDAYAKCQSENTPGSPEYTQCNRDYDTCRNAIDGSKWLLTNQWDKAESIGIAYEDGLGTEHSFDDIEEDMIMDVFNVNDDGYMVAEITSITKGDDGVGIVYKVLQSKGEANGPVSMKFFHLSTEIDPEVLTNFVRKTGDEMTGRLQIKPKSGNNALLVQGAPNVSDAQNVLNVYSNTGKQVFWVDSTHAGVAGDALTPTSTSHLTSKQYVDKAVSDAIKNIQFPTPKVDPAPAQLAWRFDSSTNHDGPADGYFKRDDSNIWRFSFKTNNGLDIGQSLVDIDKPHGRDIDMTAWFRISGDKWKMKAHYHIKEWRWNYTSGGIAHFEMHQAAAYGVKLANGTTYHVTIGGWF